MARPNPTKSRAFGDVVSPNNLETATQPMMLGARAPQGEREIRLDQIEIGERLRALSETTVCELMVSIAEVGLAQPIVVRIVELEDGTLVLRLVAGAHRLEACRRLGWTTIRARILNLSEVDARQIEIDENLVRADLTPLDFARFVGDRLEIYAERHPDLVATDPSEKKGGRGRPPKNFAQLAKRPGCYVRAVMGFAEEVALDTKLSRRSLYNAIQVWSGLYDVADRIQGTPIARNAGLLRQIAAVSPDQRAAVVDQLIETPTRRIADAIEIAQGRVPAEIFKARSDDDLTQLKKLWGKATPSARAAFLDDLAGRSLPRGWKLIRETADE